MWPVNILHTHAGVLVEYFGTFFEQVDIYVPSADGYINVSLVLRVSCLAGRSFRAEIAHTLWQAYHLCVAISFRLYLWAAYFRNFCMILPPSTAWGYVRWLQSNWQ